MMMKPMVPLALCFFLLTLHVDAQSDKTWNSGHYSFTYPSEFTGIEAVAESFNVYWSAFNEIFRFNPDTTLKSNRVVILADKKTFDDYLVARIGETRNEFLFLKYPKPEQSELVLYISNPGESGSPAFDGPALNRQLYLQYLYSFVSEPPLWIRDGFQAYFEKITYNPVTRHIENTVYSPWLETAKKLNADPSRRIGVADILSAVTGSYESSRFYPQAWALISFFLNTENAEYQRFLCETCVFLEGDGVYNAGSQQENTDLMKTRFTRFNSAEKSDEDFKRYLAGQFTFTELFQSGVTLYNSGSYETARTVLLDALSIRMQDPMLVYYLGLVAYAEKDYEKAETWYRQSLEFGGDNSTVNWALGLNAFADKRYSEARVYIETAKTVNPSRYAEKADRILKSMPK
jgi:tetratricopeptide (TPR) repeat protein